MYEDLLHYLMRIGMTIEKILNVQKAKMKEHQSNKVLFVITTDGMENASRKYNYKMIKRMVEYQKKKYHWEFIFMGANMDAIDVANNFGIDANRAVNFHSDDQGTNLNYQAMNKVMSDFRTNDRIEDDWKKEVDEDYIKRTKV